jgi:hypothetical protein
MALSAAARRNLLPTRAVMVRDFEDPHMSLITLIIILIVVGVLLWLINTYIPMDAKIKQILNAVVVIAVVLWLLQQFGLLAQLSNIHVGH